MSDYTLQYLPLFYDDMSKIVEYISETLFNPIAASNLLDEVEEAILERLPYAESFEPGLLYNFSQKKRKHRCAGASLVIFDYSDINLNIIIWAQKHDYKSYPHFHASMA